jgi:hypothetical protein
VFKDAIRDLRNKIDDMEEEWNIGMTNS